MWPATPPTTAPLIHPLASAPTTEAIDRVAAKAVARNHFMNVPPIIKSDEQCILAKTVPNPCLLSLNARQVPIGILSSVSRVSAPTKQPTPRSLGLQHPLQMLLIFLSTLESSELSKWMASSPCIAGP